MARKRLKMPPNIPLDKTVPIPNETYPYGYWNAVSEVMVVGDSLLIKSTTYRKTLQRALGLKKAMLRFKKNAVMRTQEGGIRVWCESIIGEKPKEPIEPAVSPTGPVVENPDSTSSV